jgi:hypothetical protein
MLIVSGPIVSVPITPIVSFNKTALNVPEIKSEELSVKVKLPLFS